MQTISWVWRGRHGIALHQFIEDEPPAIERLAIGVRAKRGVLVESVRMTRCGTLLAARGLEPRAGRRCRDCERSEARADEPGWMREAHSREPAMCARFTVPMLAGKLATAGELLEAAREQPHGASVKRFANLVTYERETIFEAASEIARNVGREHMERGGQGDYLQQAIASAATAVALEIAERIGRASGDLVPSREALRRDIDAAREAPRGPRLVHSAPPARASRAAC